MASPPLVLVPGAFETADTFAALGSALGASHRVFAIDLTGTGYSVPSPPFSAGHRRAWRSGGFRSSSQGSRPSSRTRCGTASPA